MSIDVRYYIVAFDNVLALLQDMYVIFNHFKIHPNCTNKRKQKILIFCNR